MIDKGTTGTWAPVPRPGTDGVLGRVLLRRNGLLVVQLRFEAIARIDRHSAPHDIDVVCLSGSGFTSVGQDEIPVAAGETVRWPANAEHGLWTEGATMETLMVEHFRR